MDTKYRAAMVGLGRSLFERGFSVGGAGNISLLLDDGNVLATPTNSCLGRLSGPTLSVVGPGGELLSGDKMSKEIRFHLALYRVRPECRAVVHLHSTYLTALSCLDGVDRENAVTPFTPYFVMKVGKLPSIPYFRPGSPKIADALADRFRAGGRACLMTNHGAVVIGASLEEAVNAYEELEETAKLVFLLHGKKVRYLTAEEIQELEA